MQRDSIASTFLVAIVLCAVCGILVSASAVALRPLQETNKLLDQQRNVLQAAGLADPKTSDKQIGETFEARVVRSVVDLRTGEVLNDVDPDSLTPFRDAKSSDDELRLALTAENDPAKLKGRENRTVVYLIVSETDKNKVEQYVFPIRGYGLWSTLYGFLALEADLNTIKGITYYQHGETPGLGGEVDNPTWKGQFNGKQLYDAEGNVALKVFKGGAPAGDVHGVDALSGASITTAGVEKMIGFWFGEDGFKAYIDRTRGGATPETPSTESTPEEAR